DGLSQLGLASAVGWCVEKEAQRRLLGDLEARELEIEPAQLGVLEVLQALQATPHVLPGPDRREVRTGPEQLGDEPLVVGLADIPPPLAPEVRYPQRPLVLPTHSEPPRPW